MFNLIDYQVRILPTSLLVRSYSSLSFYLPIHLCILNGTIWGFSSYVRSHLTFLSLVSFIRKDKCLSLKEWHWLWQWQKMLLKLVTYKQRSVRKPKTSSQIILMLPIFRRDATFVNNPLQIGIRVLSLGHLPRLDVNLRWAQAVVQDGPSPRC